MTTAYDQSPAPAELTAQFVAMLPRIENFAGARFRYLDRESRGEAVQNTVALCWFRLLDLAKSGKHADTDVVDGMIYFSIIHTAQGRLAHGRGGSNGKDALDYSRLGLKGVRADRIDFREHVSAESPVPSQAAFRVDTPAWLETMPERNQRIALDLAAGYSTGEVSNRHKISPGRVSQLRREFERSYREFHGEA